MYKLDEECTKHLKMIVSHNNESEMDELGEILCCALRNLKEHDIANYDRLTIRMHEMAEGKVVTEEMAYEWVKSMPRGEHWNMEQTTDAMVQMGWNLDKIAFYVYANKCYNFYYDAIKDDETMALKLAKEKVEYLKECPDKLYDSYKYHYKGVRN